MKIRVLLTTLALLASAAAWGQDGARASGSARGDIWIGCGTCPHFPFALTGSPQQSVSGPVSAQVDYLGQGVPDPNTAPYGLAGEVEFHAVATLQGPLSTPLLGAYARADNVSITDSAGLLVGMELYSASAEGRTQQTYHYLGAATTTYQFDFHVEGNLSNAQAGVFGIAAIYTGQDPFFETGFIDSGYVDLDGVGLLYDPQPYSGDFSVSVTVDPGESFVLISRLSVGIKMAYEPIDVLADALHTMSLTAITGGDPALLATAVPEPAAALLLPLGLIAMFGWQRRRGRSHDA
jgi:hypothetical protein